MQTENPNQNNIIHIPCAECGESFAPSVTKTKICLQCISKKNNITQNLPKNLMLPWCKYCARFFGTNWVLCARESKELLGICLKKIAGLKRLKLIDAKFIWTEEHSRRTKLKITVQKMVSNEITLQQTFEVEFYEVYTQCDECKKDFTPHTWIACLQVRQKVKNKKTFLYLEQLLLKNELHKKSIKIVNEKFGMDFFFKKKNQAQKLVDFLNGQVPHKNKESKTLVSHDTKSATYNYKYSFYFEMPKICKDDLIILPKKLTKEFGGVNNLGICYKITKKIHLFDPVTMKKYRMNANQYFNYESEITVIPFKSNESNFYITNIYQDPKSQKFNLSTTLSKIETRFAHVEVRRESDHQAMCGTTHLGHILKHGDCAKGYDIKALVCGGDLENLDNQKYLPEVVLIRKYYPEVKKRIWKLKRMDIEKEELKKKEAEKEMEKEKKEMNAFIEEIEQDKFMRSKFNLYRDEEGIREVGDRDCTEDPEMVKLEELMKDLDIKEQKVDAERDIKNFLSELEQVNFKKK